MKIKKCMPIPGFSAYIANRDGTLSSCLKACGTGRGGTITQVNTGMPQRTLKPDVRKCDGRKRYTLRSDSGKYVRRYGSYFMLLAYVGPQPKGMEACHENGDCTDDSADNLRWDTPINNKADMVRHGTQPRGEASSSAKLTDAQAADIIRRRKAGERNMNLAVEFGVTPALISWIYKGHRKKCLRKRSKALCRFHNR